MSHSNQISNFGNGGNSAKNKNARNINMNYKRLHTTQTQHTQQSMSGDVLDTAATN